MSLTWDEVWLDLDNYRDFHYDSLGRLERMFNQYVAPYSDDPDHTETEYFYLGETGQITEVVRNGELSQTYEWMEMELTVNNYEQGEFSYREVYVFTDEGSSATSEIFPIPPAMWPITFGSGYINGCIGQ